MPNEREVALLPYDCFTYLGSETNDEDDWEDDGKITFINIA